MSYFNALNMYRCLLLILCSIVVGACSVVGPESIKAGRLAYNEAITTTGDQQMLYNIVRRRYGETSTMQSVASVTANMRISSAAGVNVGFGDGAAYAQNLVPFSGSVVYEENPTISYVPVNGEKYFRQLLSPLPLDVVAAIVSAAIWKRPVLVILLSRLNDMSNPDFIYSSTEQPDPRFFEAIDYFVKLSNAGVLMWAKAPDESHRDALLFRGYREAHQHNVDELFRLLELPNPPSDGGDIVVPVSIAIENEDRTGIVFTTRSVNGLVTILSAAVDVPEAHMEAGVVQRYPEPGQVIQSLQIRHADSKPDDAYVAVRYREKWFYIANADTPTKEAFGLVQLLWSVRVENGGANAQGAPLLTVPVSQ